MLPGFEGSPIVPLNLSFLVGKRSFRCDLSEHIERRLHGLRRFRRLPDCGVLVCLLCVIVGQFSAHHEVVRLKLAAAFFHGDRPGESLDRQIPFLKVVVGLRPETGELSPTRFDARHPRILFFKYVERFPRLVEVFHRFVEFPGLGKDLPHPLTALQDGFLGIEPASGNGQVSFRRGQRQAVVKQRTLQIFALAQPCAEHRVGIQHVHQAG